MRRKKSMMMRLIIIFRAPDDDNNDDNDDVVVNLGVKIFFLPFSHNLRSDRVHRIIIIIRVLTTQICTINVESINVELITTIAIDDEIYIYIHRHSVLEWVVVDTHIHTKFMSLICGFT